MGMVMDRFRAKSKKGHEVIIVEYERYGDASTLNTRGFVRKLSRFELEDGSSGVNKIDDQTFKIVQTGEIVHRTN